MYLIARSTRFEKSFRKLKKSGTLKVSIQKELSGIITTLAIGKRLKAVHADHQLQGEFKEYRECHIKSDLLLIYRIDINKDILVLIDIGSHSQLFG